MWNVFIGVVIGYSIHNAVAATSVGEKLKVIELPDDLLKSKGDGDANNHL